MIKLFDGWIIDTDERNYILIKVTTAIKRKTKEEYEYRNVYGYFSNIPAALRTLRDELVKQKISSGIYTLEEALKAIAEEDDRIERMLKQINLEVDDGK